MLPEHDRAILAYFHGLEGQGWHSGRELVEHLGTTHWLAMESVQRSEATLLGAEFGLSARL